MVGLGDAAYDPTGTEQNPLSGPDKQFFDNLEALDYVIGLDCGQEMALWDTRATLLPAILSFLDQEEWSGTALAAIRHFLKDSGKTIEDLNAFKEFFYKVVNELAPLLQLQLDELDYLFGDEDMFDAIQELFSEHGINDQTTFTANIFIDVGSAGYLFGPYDEDEYDEIIYDWWNLTGAQWIEFAIFHASAIRKWESDHPGQTISKGTIYKLGVKAYFKAKSGIVHTFLDICGLAPVVGEGCDGLNGVLYLIEGDGLNASLSFAATIPFAGWTATGSKWAAKVFTFKGTKLELKLTREANGLIDFGDRGKLRDVLKITSSNHEAHHIIPWEHADHDLVQKAADAKTNTYHMNHAANGKELEKFRKNTNPDGTHAYHPQYNDAVRDKMDVLYNELVDHYGGPNNIPPDIASQKLVQLQDNIGSVIDANPTIKINDLARIMHKQF